MVEDLKTWGPISQAVYFPRSTPLKRRKNHLATQKCTFISIRSHIKVHKFKLSYTCRAIHSLKWWSFFPNAKLELMVRKPITPQIISLNFFLLKNAYIFISDSATHFCFLPMPYQKVTALFRRNIKISELCHRVLTHLQRGKTLRANKIVLEMWSEQ